jgi:hypothetical protein
MAIVNTYAPNGFQMVNQFAGYAPNYTLTTRKIAKANTNKIAYGDVVRSLSTGYIDIATTTQQVLGVFFGCEYYDTAQQSGFGQQFNRQWPGVSTATADPLAYVCQDPTAVFQVQCSGTSAITNASIGLNINFTANGTPNTIGFSTAAADTTTVSTTNTLPFRILGISQQYGIGLDNTQPNNFILVRLNNCDANSTTGQ